jgi:hypothetical protein
MQPISQKTGCEDRACSAYGEARRSLVVLASFKTAFLVVLIAPRFAFGPICAVLTLHSRPEAPGK